MSGADSNEVVYTSGEESIEIKKQCGPQSGDLPAQVGELLAQMHMLLTKKILRVLIAKKQVARFKTIKSITSKGLYIHREIGPVLAK